MNLLLIHKRLELRTIQPHHVIRLSTLQTNKQTMMYCKLDHLEFVQFKWLSYFMLGKWLHNIH